MKARVKATGEIIEISEGCSYVYAEHYDKSYNLNELEFLDVDVKEKSLPKDDPDYWEKLKHQYIGMILSATYSSTMFQNTSKEDLYKNAIFMARELVDKLKEESQCQQD